MAFTVTATQSGSSSQGGNYLKVLVFNGAIEAGGASSGNNDLTGATLSASLTPNTSQSLPVWAFTADGAVSVLPAAAANNTYYDNLQNNTDFWDYADGSYTGTVTAATPLTYGIGSSPGGIDHTNWCAYEIRPSVAGVTPVLDASTPLIASILTHTLAVTTASFNPPAGAVLAALVGAGGTGSGTGITVTMTDTAGMGLAWTRRSISNTTDNFQPVFIFTTTIPGSAVGILPQQAKKRMPAYFTRISAPSRSAVYSR